MKFSWQKGLLELLDKTAVSKTWTYYRELSETEFLPIADLRQRQLKKIQEIAGFAYERSDLYRAKFSNAGIHPRDINSFADFRKIPYLSRQELAGLSGQPAAAKTEAPPGMFMKTSGTTGEPRQVVLSHDSAAYKYALLLRHLHAAGWEFGQKSMKFITQEEYYALKKFEQYFRIAAGAVSSFLGRKGHDASEYYRFVHNKLIYEAMHGMKLVIYDARKADLLEHKAEEYVKLISGYRPALVIARADFACLMANGIIRRRIKRPKIPVLVLIGSLLTNSMSRRIKEVFDCKLFNVYGTSELGYVAGSCGYSSEHLHINCESHYVELVPFKNSKAGYLLITDLTNKACPLIRYRPGDTACFVTEPCVCPRTLPLIKLQGREDGLMVDREHRVYTECEIMEKLNRLLEFGDFQLVQKSGNEAELHLKAGFDDARFRNMRNFLAKEMNGFNVILKKTTAIRPEPSGKFRIIKGRTFSLSSK